MAESEILAFRRGSKTWGYTKGIFERFQRPSYRRVYGPGPVTGTDGALKAMEQNEVLTNKKYKDALNWEVSPTAKAIIEKGAVDEEMHLRFIREKIKNR